MGVLDGVHMLQGEVLGVFAPLVCMAFLSVFKTEMYLTRA